MDRAAPPEPLGAAKDKKTSVDRKGWLTMTHQTHRFALRYSRWMRALAQVTALGPRRSRVDLSDDELQVRMGWGFQARIPRRSIKQARRLGRQRDIWYAVGIHTL